MQFTPLGVIKGDTRSVDYSPCVHESVDLTPVFAP